MSNLNHFGLNHVELISRFGARNTGGGGAKKYFKFWSQEYGRVLERKNTSRFGARNTGGVWSEEILQGLEPGILGLELRNTSRFGARNVGGVWSQKYFKVWSQEYWGGVWSEEILQGSEPGILEDVGSEEILQGL